MSTGPERSKDRVGSKVKEIHLEDSQSICPTCKKVIDCRIFSRNDRVYMVKDCQDHGGFETLIYTKTQDYLDADRYNKPGSTPLHYQAEVDKGCPYDCGICKDHEQHSCLGIVEITDRCNMKCPVCFASTEGSYTLSLEKVKEMVDLFIKCEGEPEILQISGGEPTIHPQIFEILEYIGKKPIKYPVLNTNGIKLSDREFAKRLSETMENGDENVGRPLIYLQFDGLTDETYEKIRGRPMLDIKMKAIENCREFGMTVTLVPTLVKGVNDHEIGAIVDLALNDNNIKMVNFQPATFVGRFELDMDGNDRITIPDVLVMIEEQTGGLIPKKSFINIPCPYPTCSACAYIYKQGEEFMVLSDLFDMDDYMDYLKNRTLPTEELAKEVKENLDALLSMSAVMGSESSEEALCNTCGIMIPNIKQMIGNITLISTHAFQDEMNLDLKRIKKCCITEILPNGQMIPFCAYNNLYRDRLTPTFKDL